MFRRTFRPELGTFGIMASILEQYEQAASFSPAPTISSSLGERELRPMFTRHRVNFCPTDTMTKLCTGGDIILIAMANDLLLRINQRQPDVPEEMDLSKYTSNLKLGGMFLSPNGEHALLSMVPKLPDAQAELLHLPRTSNRLRPLHKFRRLVVTAVAWCGNVVLVGTSRGLLIETQLSSDSDGLFASSSGDYWKQVFDIGKGNRANITGLHVINQENGIHVLATTSNKIYHFYGQVGLEERPLLQQVFRTYLSIPERCETIPNMNNYSRLDVIKSNLSGQNHYAWLTDSGVYYGAVPGGDNLLLSEGVLIPYPDNKPPTDLTLTQLHVLLLYDQHVAAISLLTHQLVFQDWVVPQSSPNVDDADRPRQLVRESQKGKLFVLTGRTVYTYKVTAEDRDVWRFHLAKGEYDKARDCCNDSPLYLDEITLRQAEALFDSGDIELSAYYYSQCLSVSFEEVAVKLLRAGETGALVKFLRMRLDRLLPENSMQRTMLVVWLVELYLSLLGASKNKREEESLQSELDELLALKAVKECVAQNKGTIHDLMATHGDIVNMVKLAIAQHDYDRVVWQHVYKREYKEALEVLQKMKPDKKELFYVFAPILIRHIPAPLVRTLTAMGRGLQPRRLLQALALTYEDESSAREAAQYLQFCVDSLGSTEQSLHNLLLALYVKHQPDRLRVYLAQQGQDASAVKYDIHFALRLCQAAGLQEACVQLSALLGLWNSALELALSVNVQLAVQTASSHTADPDLAKSLWLRIAEHVVKEKGDIKSAMEFLGKCSLLNIEDILPFFPDFVTIDEFKGPICDSLQEYRQHIQDLQDEMDETSRSAELIQEEMSAFKNRHVVVTWSDTCAGCSIQLLLRSFYCFPCGHHFHTDCLLDTVLPSLPPATALRLKELQRQLGNCGGDDVSGVSSVSSVCTGRELVQSSIDAILAGECCLCGDLMLESVDKPFVSESEWDITLKEWL